MRVVSLCPSITETLVAIGGLPALKGVTRYCTRPKGLLWGVPRAYESQGFHAMAWGPQGDLYCAFGDAGPPERWRHWTIWSTSNAPGTIMHRA